VCWRVCVCVCARAWCVVKQQADFGDSGRHLEDVDMYGADGEERRKKANSSDSTTENYQGSGVIGKVDWVFMICTCTGRRPGRSRGWCWDNGRLQHLLNTALYDQGTALYSATVTIMFWAHYFIVYMMFWAHCFIVYYMWCWSDSWDHQVTRIPTTYTCRICLLCFHVCTQESLDIQQCTLTLAASCEWWIGTCTDILQRDQVNIYILERVL